MDAHRPARADLGLPSPGVAGDADAGTREYPMHRCPFTLIRFWVTTPEGRWSIPGQSGWPLFRPRRNEWPLRAVVEAYLQRSHQEHGHRFLKRHLLATAYQTPRQRMRNGGGESWCWPILPCGWPEGQSPPEL